MNQKKKRKEEDERKERKKRTLQLAIKYFSRASRNSNEIITKCRQ